MKRTAGILGAGAAALALVSCVTMADGNPYVGLENDPTIRVVGESVTCVPVSRIRSSNVQGDGVIDFTVAGGKTYRNVLNSSCPTLREDDPISYEVFGGNLCRGEVVYKLERFANNLERGAACSLGEFTPIEYADEVSDAPMIMGD